MHVSGLGIITIRMLADLGALQSVKFVSTIASLASLMETLTLLIVNQTS
jgi:hypothetical protein